MTLEAILQYLDGLLGIAEHPDYDHALNGLQVQGPEEVEHLAAAVDVSRQTVTAAVDAGAQLLLVHHGLFWGGLRPITGPTYERIATLVRGGVGLYSAHLPLDSHPELGNCALLARALGLELRGRFGRFRGAEIGWWGETDGGDPMSFVGRVSEAVGGRVRLLSGGDRPVRRVAVVTGGGGSFISEAARSGVDTLVTGEASHHAYVDALELGVHVLLAGHYATETYGVKALAAHLAERFGLTWTFLDFPSGL